MLAQMLARVRVNAGPIVPTGTAAVTGTATASISESDIVAGGKTIILTLTNDTWVASGATFDAQRQAIINGLTSAQSETFGWNNVVKAGLATSTVVRTSSTVVTITLSAFATYNITSAETITVTIPGSAVSLGNPIVASPTFGISVVSATVLFTMDKTNYTVPGTPAGGFYVGGHANVSDDGTKVVITTPAGTPIGSAPIDMFTTSVGYDTPEQRTVIIGAEIDSLYYVAPSSGHNKTWGFMEINGGSGKKAILRFFGSGIPATTPVTAGFGTQNTVSGDTNYDSGYVMTPNVAYKLEWRVRSNTTGTADGGFTFLVNDVVILDVNNIQWTASAQLWAQENLTPILGGAGGINVPASFTQRCTTYRVEKP